MLENLSDKDKKGIIIIVVAIAFIGALGILKMTLEARLPADNFCIAEDKVDDRAYHTVIIDMTDKFDGGAINGIINYLNKELDHPEKEQDKIEVYILDKENFTNKTQSIPISHFSICHPGDPELNTGLTENINFARARYESYQAKILSIKDRMVNASPASQSPILEMIDSVSETLPKDRETNLYIISDMLHNNVFYSQHKQFLDFNEFKNEKGSYYDTIRPSISGASVNILYVKRPQYQNLQSLEHENFWKRYFMDNNVESVYLKRL